MTVIDSKAAQRYLGQIKRLDVRINNKLEELSRVKALAVKVTTSLRQDAGFGGGNHDKIGDAVAKIIALEKEIDSTVDALIDRKRIVSGIIEKVQNTDQMDVLHKHYILHESLDQIADELCMTRRNVCYIHGRALLSVAAIMQEQGIKEERDTE